MEGTRFFAEIGRVDYARAEGGEAGEHCCALPLREGFGVEGGGCIAVGRADGGILSYYQSRLLIFGIIPGHCDELKEYTTYAHEIMNPFIPQIRSSTNSLIVIVDSRFRIRRLIGICYTIISTTIRIAEGMNQAHPVAEFVDECVATTSGVVVGDFVVFRAKSVPVHDDTVSGEATLFREVGILF